jgi:hypothetical protein
MRPRRKRADISPVRIAETPARGARYSDQARDAIRGAFEAEHDFGGWLAAVLASVAAELGFV